MAMLSEIVGFRGVFRALQALNTSPADGLPCAAVESIMAEDAGDRTAPDLLEQMLSAGVVREKGHRLQLTTFGTRTYLLLEALNGGDLRQLFGRMREVDASTSMYQLVRQGMTERFLESLVTRPGFGRLYICSPWINLSRRAIGFLTHGVHQMEKRHGRCPELLVITRPTEAGVPDGALALRDMGATFFFHSRLHSKVYVREPGIEGGTLIAVVGSQNLTKSSNLELGIWIDSDSYFINQLIRYFYDLSNYCVES